MASQWDTSLHRKLDTMTFAELIRKEWGALDGALHAVAFAPRDALGGDFLEARPEVTKVHYAGLASSPWHARSAQYLPNGNGAIVAP